VTGAAKDSMVVIVQIATAIAPISQAVMTTTVFILYFVHLLKVSLVAMDA
jgi:hypothetical protein